MQKGGGLFLLSESSLRPTAQNVHTAQYIPRSSPVIMPKQDPDPPSSGPEPVELRGQKAKAHLGDVPDNLAQCGGHLERSSDVLVERGVGYPSVLNPALLSVEAATRTCGSAVAI